MRALLQRVTEASVKVDGKTIGSCGNGLLILLGVCSGDTRSEAAFLAEKCLNLRIFSDDEGKMNRSLLDIQGGILVISQFTLYADTRRGRRPSFVEAAGPEVSQPLYEYFVECLRSGGVAVETGIFGAEMQVSLVNDGPVTIMLEKNSE
ncbi:MAG: D-tyrosyl-tRNA(Tyr) deacylase [Lentisphaerae bacterium]|jgi:D-tyrosyl-tRNA(Tyr) deacylase|nr:D-tyrosyl-tRNA(Tyr) deacylase [Lentisphaerota bacterium]